MPRTTVADVIAQVLKASAKPMSAREIYDSIVAGKLYADTASGTRKMVLLRKKDSAKSKKICLRM